MSCVTRYIHDGYVCKAIKGGTPWTEIISPTTLVNSADKGTSQTVTNQIDPNHDITVTCHSVSTNISQLYPHGAVGAQQRCRKSPFQQLFYAHFAALHAPKRSASWPCYGETNLSTCAAPVSIRSLGHHLPTQLLLVAKLGEAKQIHMRIHV
jgi:hypothetical protein